MSIAFSAFDLQLVLEERAQNGLNGAKSKTLGYISENLIIMISLQSSEYSSERKLGSFCRKPHVQQKSGPSWYSIADNPSATHGRKGIVIHYAGHRAGHRANGLSVTALCQTAYESLPTTPSHHTINCWEFQLNDLVSGRYENSRTMKLAVRRHRKYNVLGCSWNFSSSNDRCLWWSPSDRHFAIHTIKWWCIIECRHVQNCF